MCDLPGNQVVMYPGFKKIIKILQLRFDSLNNFVMTNIFVTDMSANSVNNYLGKTPLGLHRTQHY